MAACRLLSATTTVLHRQVLLKLDMLPSTRQFRQVRPIGRATKDVAFAMLGPSLSQDVLCAGSHLTSTITCPEAISNLYGPTFPLLSSVLANKGLSQNNAASPFLSFSQEEVQPLVEKFLSKHVLNDDQARHVRTSST